LPLGVDPNGSLEPQPVKSVELSSVPLSQVIQLFYQNNGKDYVMSPEVIQDTIPVSFRFSGNVDLQFLQLLSGRGYTVSQRGGVDYISKTSLAVAPDSKPFIYYSKYRDPVDLSRSLQPFFSGRFGSIGSVSSTPVPVGKDISPTSATASLDKQSDYLTFFGTQKEIDQLKTLLKTIDIPTPSVEIKAVLYEVSISDNSGSSLSIVGQSLGRSGIGFGLNTGTPVVGGGGVSLSGAGFSVVYSSLKSDGRFVVLSSPSLRVDSGGSSSLVVGQEVPVLGSVSYGQGSSTPVQSVEYRPSGAIFTVSPIVYRNVVKLNLHQELSDFVSTTSSGVDSPTKLTRKIDSHFTLKPGEIVFIGGIDTNKNSDGKSRFLFFKNRTKSNNKTQLLLMIQCNIIGDSP
jgi:general secretion pathway protein D